MAGLMLVLLTMTLKGNFDAANRDVLRFSAEVTDLVERFPAYPRS